jgi:hypothetical protein
LNCASCNLSYKKCEGIKPDRQKIHAQYFKVLMEKGTNEEEGRKRNNKFLLLS